MRIRGRFFQGEPLRKPRWLKYGWWIYTERDAIETRFEFRNPLKRMSTFDAMLRARDLDDRFETYFLVNWTYKRDDPSAPWDIARVRANGGQVAPAYDEDDDRPWRGHK
jgi:hypothetical protein